MSVLQTEVSLTERTDDLDVLTEEAVLKVRKLEVTIENLPAWSRETVSGYWKTAR